MATGGAAAASRKGGFCFARTAKRKAAPEGTALARRELGESSTGVAFGRLTHQQMGKNIGDYARENREQNSPDTGRHSSHLLSWRNEGESPKKV